MFHILQNRALLESQLKYSKKLKNSTLPSVILCNWHRQLCFNTRNSAIAQKVHVTASLYRTCSYLSYSQLLVILLLSHIIIVQMCFLSVHK